ncbi:MAG TPA: hypothetical protein VGA56_24320 [Opitutaceae bacterium]
MNQPVPHESPVSESEAPDVPGLKTWRGVYLFVIGCFVFFVVLLTIFTGAFS